MTDLLQQYDEVIGGSFTEIICIIDKSGSMDSIKTDAIGGFNSFLSAQKAVPGRALMTVVLFDTFFRKIEDGRELASVSELNSDTYVPGGMTALLDAIGRTIDEVQQRNALLPENERPTRTIVAIITDGQENSSRHYSREQIFLKINELEATSAWQFMFLAANQDAIAEASKLGIDGNLAMNFTANSVGTRSVYMAMSNAVSSYRASGEVGANWNNTTDSSTENN